MPFALVIEAASECRWTPSMGQKMHYTGHSVMESDHIKGKMTDTEPESVFGGYMDLLSGVEWRRDRYERSVCLGGSRALGHERVDTGYHLAVNPTFL